MFVCLPQRTQQSTLLLSPTSSLSIPWIIKEFCLHAQWRRLPWQQGLWMKVEVQLNWQNSRQRVTHLTLALCISHQQNTCPLKKKKLELITLTDNLETFTRADNQWWIHFSILKPLIVHNESTCFKCSYSIFPSKLRNKFENIFNVCDQFAKKKHCFLLKICKLKIFFFTLFFYAYLEMYMVNVFPL